MLMGHAEGLPKLGSSKDLLLANPVSDVELIGGDEKTEPPQNILYLASFDELAFKVVQYDTIIWLSISLLLVLAWGIGIIMLLYLPIRRYVLRKEVSSRKLYVTHSEIVYKVSRPSFIPFCGVKKIERRVPLSRVIDIVVEQGCLQSKYGIHTIRIESIAHQKAAPVDQLRIQGVNNPGHLRKVIVTEASKVIQNFGRSWKPTSVHSFEREHLACMESSSKEPTFYRSPSKSCKMEYKGGSQRYAAMESKGAVPADVVLHKLEEVKMSVRKIELLIEKSQSSSQIREWGFVSSQ